MSGLITVVRTMEEGKKYLIHSRQDCDPVIKENQRVRERLERAGHSATFKTVARIPMVSLYQWGKDDGCNYYGHLDRDVSIKLVKRINSLGKNSELRIWRGNISAQDVKN